MQKIFKHPKVIIFFADHISNREVKLMAYLTVFMSLIFIGVVPQLAYKYSILDKLPL